MRNEETARQIIELEYHSLILLLITLFAGSLTFVSGWSIYVTETTATNGFLFVVGLAASFFSAVFLTLSLFKMSKLKRQ